MVNCHLRDWVLLAYIDKILLFATATSLAQVKLTYASEDFSRVTAGDIFL